jgi:hypothetical protein
LDTREKIITAEQLGTLDGSAEWTTVVGLFDPLTAVQARRLCGRNVLAIVLDAPDTLLPTQARAELVAALRNVKAVLIAKPETWRSQLPKFCSTIVEDLEEERDRTAEFVNFVLHRQRNGSCA